MTIQHDIGHTSRSLQELANRDEFIVRSVLGVATRGELSQGQMGRQRPRTRRARLAGAGI